MRYKRDILFTSFSFICKLITLCWNLNKVGFEIPPHVSTEIICLTIEVSNSVFRKIPSLTSFRDIHWYTAQKGSSYVKWKSQNAPNIVDLPLKMTVSMRNENQPSKINGLAVNRWYTNRLCGNQVFVYHRFTAKPLTLEGWFLIQFFISHRDGHFKG